MLPARRAVYEARTLCLVRSAFRSVLDGARPEQDQLLRDMVDGSDAQRVAGSKRANRPSDRRHHADADRAEIATTRAQVTTTEVIKLDGSESKVSNGTATARWDGPALVV